MRGRRRNGFCSDRCRMQYRRIELAARRHELFARIEEALREAADEPIQEALSRRKDNIHRISVKSTPFSSRSLAMLLPSSQMRCFRGCSGGQRMPISLRNRLWWALQAESDAAFRSLFLFVLMMAAFRILRRLQFDFASQQ